MTLGQFKDEIIDWFGSGFCNLTQSSIDNCYKYYPLSFWNLTIGQFIFLVIVVLNILIMLSLILDEISPLTRYK